MELRSSNNFTYINGFYLFKLYIVYIYILKVSYIKAFDIVTITEQSLEPEREKIKKLQFKLQHFRNITLFEVKKNRTDKVVGWKNIMVKSLFLLLTTDLFP